MCELEKIFVQLFSQCQILADFLRVSRASEKVGGQVEHYSCVQAEKSFAFEKKKSFLKADCRENLHVRKLRTLCCMIPRKECECVSVRACVPALLLIVAEKKPLRA